MLKQSQSKEVRSSQDQAKYVPAGTGPAYCGPGDRITYLLTGAETGGAFFMAEVSVAPGGGPPPHVHSREDESFYLQQGTLAVLVGEKTLNIAAGDFVQMPRGVAHSFKNVGADTAKLLMVATPAGLENYFAETFFPAEEIGDIPQPGPAVIARAMKTAPKYGLELLPPAGIRH